MNYSETLLSATEILRKAKRVLVLTGAGISAESGIPTFRGGGGSDMWRGMPFDQLSSARLVEDDLPLLWDWFDYRRGVVGNCRPNAAHETLARASRFKRFSSFVVVTQNIDGLHQAADTEEVIELHGNLWRARCLSCGKTESLKVIPQDERPPVCTECIDSMRPDVVLFGEALPAANLYRAQELAGKCDVCIVIGTSAQVYPAAALPHAAQASGACVIEVNPEETELTAHADLSLHGKASEVLFDLFTFLEEPFEDLEEVAALDVDLRLDEIRIDSEPEPQQSEEEASLSFLLSEEFEGNRELVLEVGYESAGAQIYLFRPEDGQPFFFVSGNGITRDEEGGEQSVEWEPELVGSVADGIRTIAEGDKIFYSEGLFVNPDFREEVAAYLDETAAALPDDEVRKLELFQRPVTADAWIGVAEERMRQPKSEERVETATVETEPRTEAPVLTNPFAEPLVEVHDGVSGEAVELSARHFLLFWRDTSVTTAERLGEALHIVSSNQLGEISRGDTIWIVTVDKGELVLVGRMRTGEIIDRTEAEKRFGDELVWKSNLFAVALDGAECELPRRINLGEQAYELRFMDDDSDRFVKVDGRISRSQTRKIRELTAGSVEMLVSVWQEDKTAEVSDEDLGENLFLVESATETEEDPEPIADDERRVDRFEGCLLGGAVGDALGAAVEFHSIGTIRETHGEHGLSDYVEAYGKIGAITDDTQMTLFTAEGLLRAETRRSLHGSCYPAGMIYQSYLRWLQTQGRMLDDDEIRATVYDGPSWLRDIPEMNAVRAPGTTCLESLESGRMGTLEEPINDRKGCGGVMRVAPVGLIALDPFRLACETAAITHGHPSGYLSAGVFALIIGKIISGEALLEAAEHAVYEILPQYRGHEETFEACDRAIRLAKLHLGLGDGDGSGEGDPINVCSPGPEAVESLGAGWIAEEALAISLYCSLVHEDDFAKSVLLAINHSGDSDSTGAMTGNIMGALMGRSGIPEAWLHPLEMRDVVAEIARDLAIGFRADDDWGEKYPGH